jgi:hypothetical protein
VSLGADELVRITGGVDEVIVLSLGLSVPVTLQASADEVIE